MRFKYGNNAVGFNSLRKLSHNNCTLHAEIDAMNKLCNNAKGDNKRVTTVNLIVVRTNKQGELRYSRPCNDCIRRLKHLYSRGYRLRYVYYSGKNGEIIREKYSDMY